MNTSVNKTYQCKITAPPRTFKIDIFGRNEDNPHSYITVSRHIKLSGLGIHTYKIKARKKSGVRLRAAASAALRLAKRLSRGENHRTAVRRQPSPLRGGGLAAGARRCFGAGIGKLNGNRAQPESYVKTITKYLCLV